MAWEKAVLVIPGALAAADLSTKQFYCVRKNTVNNQYALATADGQVVSGVLQNKPNAAGAAAEVMAIGITKVIAGGTLAAGDFWGTDANGKAITKSQTLTGADIGDWIAGEVIEGAAAGDLAVVTIGMVGFVVQ